VLRAHADDPPPPAASFYLPELLFLDAEAFRARFRTTPLWRATREGLARNTAVVLGYRGDVDAVPFLERAREEHESALVREHAGWALEQLPS
jgi:epoxyqueuosine reductase